MNPAQVQVGDKVLYQEMDHNKPKFGENPYSGPYEIQKIRDNGSVTIKMGPVLETVNIRLIKPFKE